MKKLLTLALLAAMFSTAHAATLVTNGNFDDLSGSGATDPYPGYVFVYGPTSVPGFRVASAAGNGYIYGDHGTANGTNVAFFRTGNGPATLTTTTPVATVAAGLNYTITLDIGSEVGLYDGAPIPGDVMLQFLAGSSAPGSTYADATLIGTPLSPFIPATATAGEDLHSATGDMKPQFLTYSVTLTAAEATAYSGDYLYFQVYSDSASESQDEFDNISLSVPEPSTYALLLGGLTMLIGLRRIRQSRAN